MFGKPKANGYRSLRPSVKSSLLSLVCMMGILGTSPHAVGACLSFDGAGSYLQLPPNLIWSSETLTLELWFKTTGSGVIFGYQDALPGTKPPVSNFVPAIYVDTAGYLHATFWSDASDTPGAIRGIRSTTAVDDGEWHHVALVGLETDQAAYLDGEFLGDRPANILHYQMKINQLGTGRTDHWENGNWDWMPYEGLVDEIRVWHTARSQESIRSTKDAMLVGDEPGLVGYWPLEEGTGQFVADLSGTQADGVLGESIDSDMFDPIWSGQDFKDAFIFDEFDADTITPPWFWIREHAEKWSLTERPGYLRIYSEDGDIWSVPDRAKNMLVRPLEAENVEIIVNFQANPIVDFQQVALFIFEDGDNYVKNCLVHADYRGGLGVHLGKDIDDYYLSQAVTIDSHTEYYLKLRKVGQTYTGYYSFDGFNWIQNGIYTNIPIEPVLIGFGTWNSNGQTGPTSEMVVDFDRFDIAYLESEEITPTPTVTKTPIVVAPPTRTPTSSPTPQPTRTPSPTATSLNETTLVLSPEEATTDDDLIAFASWNPDNAVFPVRFEFDWFRNGNEIHNETAFVEETSFESPSGGGNKLADLLHATSVLSTTHTTRGDAIECHLSVFAPNLAGLAMASIQIRNSPPTAPVVKILPEFPTPFSGMAVYLQEQSTDPDGDSIFYLFEWYERQGEGSWLRRPELSGNLIPFFPGEPEISQLYTQFTQAAETWKVEVTPVEAQSVVKKGQTIPKGAPSPVVGPKGVAETLVFADLNATDGADIFDSADLIAFMEIWGRNSETVPPHLRGVFFDANSTSDQRIGPAELLSLCLRGWHRQLGD